MGHVNVNPQFLAGKEEQAKIVILSEWQASWCYFA
jgi:hypothetical protein